MVDYNRLDLLLALLLVPHTAREPSSAGEQASSNWAQPQAIGSEPRAAGAADMPAGTVANEEGGRQQRAQRGKASGGLLEPHSSLGIAVQCRLAKKKKGSLPRHLRRG